LTPISIQRIASAAAKAADCWSDGALALALTLQSDTVDRWQVGEGGPSRYRGRKSETRYGRRCIRPDRKE
jgi:hypothetical protein